MFNYWRVGGGPRIEQTVFLVALLIQDKIGLQKPTSVLFGVDDHLKFRVGHELCDAGIQAAGSLQFSVHP